MITLSDALKYTRRGTYKHGDKWRALVAVRTHRQVPVLWDEVKSLMDASSLGIENARRATLTFHLERGGSIRVAAIGDLTDAYLHGGRELTHIIWLYEPEPKVKQYMRTMLRSASVPAEELRVDTAEW